MPPHRRGLDDAGAAHRGGRNRPVQVRRVQGRPVRQACAASTSTWREPTPELPDRTEGRLSRRDRILDRPGGLDPRRRARDSGEYDVITEFRTPSATRSTATPSVVPIKNGPGVLMYMMFNHKKGPTTDLNIRKAVQSMVVPRGDCLGGGVEPRLRVTNPSIYRAGKRLQHPTPLRALQTGRTSPRPRSTCRRPATRAIRSPSRSSPRRPEYRVEWRSSKQLKRAGINAVVLSYDLNLGRQATGPQRAQHLHVERVLGRPVLYEPEFNGTFPSRGGRLHQPGNRGGVRKARARDPVREARRARRDLQRLVL